MKPHLAAHMNALYTSLWSLVLPPVPPLCGERAMARLFDRRPSGIFNFDILQVRYLFSQDEGVNSVIPCMRSLQSA
jgi:hypothetical protein